jgi:GMP synthase (glutamine-hydrolysing)
MGIEVVFTERTSQLTAARAENYALLRTRLEVASGQPVEASHYDDLDPARLRRASAVVLSGATAPWSDHDPAALEALGEAVRSSGRPVLGICAGMQLEVLFAGGAIGPCERSEHGFLPITIHDGTDLLHGLPTEAVVFQDHDAQVAVVPKSFRVLASSDACAVQAIGDSARRWWGTQFHPEEFSPRHPAGELVLRTFIALAA